VSLRLRVVLIAGLALALVWGAAAAWLAHDIHRNLDRTLDERLAMSARMVSGLLQRAALQPGASSPALEGAVSVGGGQGIACQIRSLRGEILAASGDPTLAARAAPPPGFADVETGGALWRTYTLHVDDFVVTTADRVDERDALVRGIVVAAGMPVLLAVLGGLVALWIGIGRGLAPLDALRRQLQARAADATDPVDAGGAPAELRPLLSALNGLLERLSLALAQQRAFTDAAAHELRTPLTGIDTHLQLARLSGGDARDAALDRAGSGVARMRRTLDQLLALARAEVAPAVDDPCPSVLAAVRDAIGSGTNAANGRVACALVGEDRASPMPHSMLVTAVRNLLDNALRHAPGDSTVEVAVECAVGEAACVIRVADRGPGLTAEEMARVGQRFWRGDRGRPDGAGAGLGISIVRAIAARHGGELQLRAREGGGLVAVLRVPAA